MPDDDPRRDAAAGRPTRGIRRRVPRLGAWCLAALLTSGSAHALDPVPTNIHDVNNVAGVRVASAGGDVGSGGNTRIRGASSMSLSSEPLVYIDGVRVNNAAADAGGFPGNGGVDSRYAPSRINDITPDGVRRRTSSPETAARGPRFRPGSHRATTSPSPAERTRSTTSFSVAGIATKGRWTTTGRTA